MLLDSFIEITGYARKYAIQLLNREPQEDKLAIVRPRLPIYSPEVQQALFLAWRAALYICPKRLVPFLPTLLPSLEQHGRLHLAEEQRRLLLTMSSATAERLLRTQRKPTPRGLSTTKAGNLLKYQIPIRTFAGWENTQPGFLEADLMAHCGGHIADSYLYTLTLTDVATGWTECLPLLALTSDQVLGAPGFAGRRVGTEGHARASTFLLDQFSQTGWGVSTQDVLVATPVVDLVAPLHLAQLAPDGSVLRVFAHRTEVCEHPRSASAPEVREGPAVALTKQASEVRGAWVILDAVPQGSGFTELANRLAKQGAIGLLAPLYATADGYLVKRIMAASLVALPVLSVRADLLPLLAGTRLQVRIPMVLRHPHGTNVLASLSGTDERLSREPLLIGAHYDALGDDPGGLRHPGATDNAAAVAVLLELARVLSHLPTPPQRPILLVAFDAEEVGAHGSHALARQFKETGKHPLVLNLDGAACQNEAVWVEPGAHTEQLLSALDQAGRWLDIPLVLGNIASDQRQFTREGFAAVGLSVGAAKLHTPADAIELVQPAALGIAARLLLAACWRLAWEE